MTTGQLDAIRAATNAELVWKAADGNAAAWAELVSRLTPFLFRIARAHGLSGVESGDVVQTAWVRLFESIAKVNKPESVGSWLATTTRRESVAVARRCQQEHLLGDHDLDVSDAALSPDGAAAAADLRIRLSTALRRLPDREQRLLRLLSASPLPTYEEVSAALDMPIGSIGPTRFRALTRLRGEIEALGVDRYALASC